MTPTEQDSNGDGILKQRIYEEIAVIFAGKDLSHKHIAALMDDRKESVELIMRLITADRKQHELQARIDELNSVEEDPWGVQHVPKPREYRNGYTVGVLSIEERIAELKQELEKL